MKTKEISSKIFEDRIALPSFEEASGKEDLFSTDKYETVGYTDTSKVDSTHPILSERLRLKASFHDSILFVAKEKDPFCKSFDRGIEVGPIFEKVFDKCPDFGKDACPIKEKV